MEYDEDKVDEMVLALLELTTFKEGMGIRASKGMTGTLWIAFTRGGTFPILRTQQSP
jgi:CRISPR/Cas system CMR-associated protein Cmr1 (group 7 of RAMP superfamily)